MHVNTCAAPAAILRTVMHDVLEVRQMPAAWRDGRSTYAMWIKISRCRPHAVRVRRSNHMSPISLRMRWRQRIRPTEKVAKYAAVKPRHSMVTGLSVKRGLGRLLPWFI